MKLIRGSCFILFILSMCLTLGSGGTCTGPCDGARGCRSGASRGTS